MPTSQARLCSSLWCLFWRTSIVYSPVPSPPPPLSPTICQSSRQHPQQPPR